MQEKRKKMEHAELNKSWKYFIYSFIKIQAQTSLKLIKKGCLALKSFNLIYIQFGYSFQHKQTEG